MNKDKKTAKHFSADSRSQYVSDSEHTTRLDTNTVISRIYDERGYPLVWIKGRYYEFCRASITRIGNFIEIKFYQNGKEL